VLTVRESVENWISGFKTDQEDPVWFDHFSQDPLDVDDPEIRILLNPFVGRNGFNDRSVIVRNPS
jgi:hypothetical protein